MDGHLSIMGREGEGGEGHNLCSRAMLCRKVVTKSLTSPPHTHKKKKIYMLCIVLICFDLF